MACVNTQSGVEGRNTVLVGTCPVDRIHPKNIRPKKKLLASRLSPLGLSWSILMMASAIRSVEVLWIGGPI
jgi:hypothetical protein